MNEEIWVGIPGFDVRYEISNFGQIRSWFAGGGAYNKGKLAAKPRILSQFLRGKKRKQYLAVFLIHEDGIGRSSQTVHGLMAKAFLGVKPEGAQVRHKDGNILNCALDNLEYGTHQQNQDDKRVHGTLPLGENVHNAKLSTQDVLNICEDLNNQISVKDIANKYGVTYSPIWAIKTKKGWTHVTEGILL